MKQIRSINGLRAIAILLVLFAHIRGSIPFDFSGSLVPIFLMNSKLGVRIFFVLSGYLITKLLLSEKESNGKINLKHFYVRRMLRILPLAYLYITIILLLKILYNPEIVHGFSNFLFAYSFTWNYKQLFVPGGSPFLDQFWTLALEEQFYLFWPILFTRFSYNTLIKFCVGVLVLLPFFRVLSYYLFPDLRGQVNMMLHTGGDTIIIGCLGALLEKNKSFNDYFLKYCKGWAGITACLVFLFIISPILFYNFGGAYDLTVGASLNNVAILFLLFYCITMPGIFTSLLNTSIFNEIGKISYSLYIWNSLLFNDLGWWVSWFPQNILSVTVVAFCSYYFFEKPILKLKRRFTHI